MPDRIRARAILVALLVLLMAAGIRALGPPGDWGQPASHALVVGVGLELVLGGLLLILRRGRRPAGGLPLRLHRLVASGLVASLVGVLVLVALSLTSPSPTAMPTNPVRNLQHLAKNPRLRHPVLAGQPVSHTVLWRDLVVAAVIVAILIALVIAWQRRPVRPHQETLPGPVAAQATVAELARAVEAGQAALRDLDDARAAIIGCYAAMEQSLARAGTERGAAETPDELLERAVAADRIRQAPAGLLTGLFYEARYSSHDLPSEQRDLAARALAELAAELPAQASR
jgi:Domain of unknown function (DUF4129)